MASRHLLNMENKGYSGALGSFSMGGNGNFSGYLDASNSVAVNLNGESTLDVQTHYKETATF